MDAGPTLASARDAHRHGDWVAAYDAFTALDGALPPDDLLAFSDAAWWTGRTRRALELGERCFRLYVEQRSPEGAATVALHNAATWAMCGHEEVASGWVGRARRQLADVPECPAHGHLWWAEAQDPATDLATRRELAARLQAVGARTRDPALGSLGLFLEGATDLEEGDMQRGLPLLDEAMLPVLAGQLAPEVAGELYCRLIHLCTDIGEFERARRWTDVAERWCDLFSAAVVFGGTCRVHRARLLLVGGELAAAERSAARAARDLATVNVGAAAMAHYQVGEARRLRGELDSARASYERAVALGHPGQPGLALLTLAEGRPEVARRELHRLLAETGDPVVRAPLLQAQAEVACALRDRATAERAVEELTAVATAYPTDGFRLWAELARGTMLIHCGSGEEAVEPLRRALTLSYAIGAEHHAATARRLLAEAVPGVAPETSGGLTGRQLEILTAVAEGLSNREVAARLVISEKTVARHLANIYTRLDVSSRTGAVAWAHRHGVLPAG